MIKNSIEYYDYQGKLFQETQIIIPFTNEMQRIAEYMVERIELFTKYRPRYKTSGKRAYDYRSILGIFVMKRMLGIDTNVKMRQYLINDPIMQKILRLESVPNLTIFSSYLKEKKGLNYFAIKH